MKNLIEAFIIFVVTLAFYILGFYAGERNKQQEIENRTDKVLKSKQINKECYNNQDIEIIVFGETQE